LDSHIQSDFNHIFIISVVCLSHYGQ